MTTISIKELLDSPNLAIYDKSKLSTNLDVQKVSAALNLKGAKFTFTTGLDLLSSTSAKADNVDKPINISHQILAEPLAAVSGSYASTSFAGTSSTTSDAFLSQASDTSKTAGSLTQDGKKISDVIGEGVKGAAKVLSSAVEGVGRSSSKANGGLLISAATELKMGANSIHLGSEGVVNVMTPVMSTNAKVMQTHANYLASISDSVTTISKSRYTELQVDQKIASYVQTVASESNRSFSKESQIVATQTNELQGKNTNVYADDHLEEASAGTMRLSSRKSGTVQSGDLFITASASTEDPANVQADGSPVKAIEGQPTGTLKIISNGIGKGTGKMIMSSSGTMSSSADIAMSAVSDSITNMAKKVMVNASNNAVYSASKSMGIVAGEAMSVGTNRSNMFFYGGMTFIGRMPPLSPPIDMNTVQFGEIIQIPELASLPTAPSGLDSCIPDKFKNKSTSPPELDFGGIAHENEQDQHIKDAPLSHEEKHSLLIDPTSLIKGESSRDNPVYGGAGKVGTSTKGKPQDNSNSSTSKVVSKRDSSNKLPNPKTVSSSISPTKQQDAFTNAGAGLGGNLVGAELIKGGLHIYPTKYRPNTAQKPDNSNVSGRDPDKHLKALPSAVRGAAKKLGTPDKTTEEVLRNLGSVITGNINKDLLSMDGASSLISETQLMANYVAAIGYFGGTSDLIETASNTFSSITGIAVPYISEGSTAARSIEALLNSDLSGLSYYTDRFLPEINPLITVGDLILRNPDASLSDLLDKGLANAISDSLSSFLDPKYASAIPSITDLILKSTNGKPLDVDALITGASSILSNLTGSDEVSTAVSLYENTRGLISDINSGNVWNVLNGGSLSNLTDFIAGPANAGAIREALDMAQSMYGTIESLTKLPDLINLMNSYDIDFLNQVNIVLNCLDLLNKINDLVSKFANFSGLGNAGAVQAAEDLPRLVEIYNTINDLPTSFIEGPDKDVIDAIKQLKLEIPLDGCFKIPTVNFLEGSIDVAQIVEGEMLFSLARPDINVLSGKLPSPGDVIQVKIKSYYRRRDLKELKPYAGEQNYTPTVISFYITDYQLDSNVGIAYVSRNYPTLLLEEPSGVIYEYDIDDIGGRLIPIVDDAYLII